MLASFGDALAATSSRRPLRFATVSEDGLLSVFDAEGGGLLHQYTRPTHLAVQWTCLAWWQPPETSTLGQLALGSDSGLIAVWDLAVGQISHELRGHTQQVNDVAFERSGRTLLTCSNDRQVCVWNTSSGELLHNFATGQAAVQRLLPSSSGEHVLLGGTIIRVMKRDTWKRLGKVPGHASKVACLCFSPDDKLAASAADDRHVSIWRVAPSALADDAAEPCVQTLALETRVAQLAFLRPDGSGDVDAYTLLTLTSSGVVGIWRFSSAAALHKKSSKKKKLGAASGGSGAMGGGAMPLSVAPACTVRVESASADSATSVEDDPQRIFYASFCGPSSILVAHGSQVYKIDRLSP